MTEKTIVCIRARTRSQRLYSKVLQPINDIPAIIRVGERVEFIRDIVDQVVFCIPDGTYDNELADRLNKHFGDDPFYTIHRGPEEQVVTRVWGAIQEHDGDIIIEGLNGDSPLCYMSFLRPALEYLKTDRELDCVVHYNPQGKFTIEHTACYAWPMRRSWWEKTLNALPVNDPKNVYELHPTLRFQWYPEEYNIGFLEDEAFFDLCLDSVGRPRDMHWCLDEVEDLVFLNIIFKALDREGPIPLKEAVAYLNAHPHIRSANAAIAESVLTYPTKLYRRKWAKVYGTWSTPPGAKSIYCDKDLCYLGYVFSEGGTALYRQNGDVIRDAPLLACDCGANRVWHR